MSDPQIRTLQLGQTGQPSHILVTDDPADCARLSDKITAVVYVPPCSDDLKNVLSDFETGWTTPPELMNRRASYIHVPVPVADSLPRIFAACSEKIIEFSSAGRSLPDDRRQAVVAELSGQQSAFFAAAMPIVSGTQPYANLTRVLGSYGHDYMHSVYLYNRTQALTRLPENLVLLGQDGLDSAAIGTVERHSQYISSSIELGRLGQPERLWRVPTGAFTLLRGRHQYVGFDTQQQSIPCAATLSFS